jgi:hypothetical protein
MLSLQDAEWLNEITRRQVSKWAKRLTDKSAYREALYDAAQLIRWRSHLGIWIQCTGCVRPHPTTTPCSGAFCPGQHIVRFE